MADDSGLLIYEPFYGLGEKPFSLSTDPRFLYRSASHAPVFQDMFAGIRRREGLVVLTGEIGLGKTTLCRSVLSALDRKTFSAFVPDPFVSREDLLKMLLVEFGVVSLDDVVRGRLRGASRAELSYPLYEFLRSLEPLDAFAVLLIDEAQNLPVSLLEEVRILADLEGTRKLLQVVLIGQPELSSALRLPHMRQVKQRVTTHCELRPLDRDGVHGYVGHRLAVAGASADRLQFTGAALDLVFEASEGVPRVINRLCDRTLQHAHAARAASIGPSLVRQAIGDLQLVLPATETADVCAFSPEPSAPPALVTAFVSEVADRSPGVEPAPVVPVRTRTGRSRSEGARFFREAPGAAQARTAVAAAALFVLGGLSGVTLAVYWAWAGPMLTERVVLPPVPRPSMRIAAPPPKVLDPAIDAVGDPIELPQLPDATDEAQDSDPSHPKPVTAAPSAESVWVVRVGAFADDGRATVLAGQLTARGFTAFKGATTARDGTLLHAVLVGPYSSRPVAARALDRLAGVAGVGQPILQLVPPAAALR